MKMFKYILDENFDNIDFQKEKVGKWIEYSSTGIHKGSKETYIILCYFIKHKQNTYALFISNPKQNYSKASKKISVMLKNVQLLKD